MEWLKRLKNRMSSKPESKQDGEESLNKVEEVRVDPIVEETIIRLEEQVPSADNGDAEDLDNVLTPYEQAKKELSDNIAKYGEKNIRNFYFGIPCDRFVGSKDPKINNIMTAVTVLDRSTMTIKAAFACCSHRDQFCKVSGKNYCFKKLNENDMKYTATVPFYGDGFISLMAAYSIVRPNLPHPFRNYKLTPTRVELLKSHENEEAAVVTAESPKSESSVDQPAVLLGDAAAPTVKPVEETSPLENVIDNGSKLDCGYREI